MVEIAEIESPIGGVTVACIGQTLVALHFADGRRELETRLGRRFGDIRLSGGTRAEEAAGRLREYFAGDICAIDSLSVDPGGTAFQQRVWAQLRRGLAGRPPHTGMWRQRSARQPPRGPSAPPTARTLSASSSPATA